MSEAVLLSVTATLDAAAKINTEQQKQLFAAVLRGDSKAVDDMKARGFNINSKDVDGNSALLALVVNSVGQTASNLTWPKDESKILDMAYKLLLLQCNVNARNSKGVSSLMIASQFGMNQMVNKLILANADVNSVDNAGTTALMYASKAGHADVVQALISGGGASVDAKDKLGNTASFFATSQGHAAVVLILSQAQLGTLSAGLPKVEVPSMSGWGMPKLEVPKMDIPGVPSMPEVGVPSMSGWGMPKLEVPKMDVPKMEMPNMDIPKMDMPKMDVPNMDMPNMDMPKMDVPNMDMPKMDMPKMDVPKMDVPNMDMPKMDMPKMDVPKMDIPAIPSVPSIGGLSVPSIGGLPGAGKVPLAEALVKFEQRKDIFFTGGKPTPWFNNPCGLLSKPDFKREQQKKTVIEAGSRAGGFLNSLTAGFAYQQRWFVLSIEEKKLKYYNDSSDVKGTAKGTVDLTTIRSVEYSRVFDRPTFAIDLIGDTQHYTLSAGNEDELHKWAVAIKRCLA
jgi:hypothetical protein